MTYPGGGNPILNLSNRKNSRASSLVLERLLDLFPATGRILKNCLANGPPICAEPAAGEHCAFS